MPMPIIPAAKRHNAGCRLLRLRGGDGCELCVIGMEPILRPVCFRFVSGVRGARHQVPNRPEKLACRNNSKGAGRYTSRIPSFPARITRMKKLTFLLLFALPLCAAAQTDAKKPPSTLRGMLLEQLHTTHDNE